MISKNPIDFESIREALFRGTVMAGLLSGAQYEGALGDCLLLLRDEDFYAWPASASGHHHCGENGLATHTQEVLRISLEMAKSAIDIYGERCALDAEVIAVAAIWHDSGKLDEYARGDGIFTKPPGRPHHIIGSAVRFSEACPNHPKGAAILHAIEAHHGRREWGSNREPGTPEALIVHQADMLSVAMHRASMPLQGISGHEV